MVESDLNLHKTYMAMKSTWNRTCFHNDNPPGCCMYRLPYEQVGPDIKGSRWVAFLLSVSWNWHLHTASGQGVLILFISHKKCIFIIQSWRWLPSMFVFGTIEDTPYIIRTGCTAKNISCNGCKKSKPLTETNQKQSNIETFMYNVP